MYKFGLFHFSLSVVLMKSKTFLKQLKRGQISCSTQTLPSIFYYIVLVEETSESRLKILYYGNLADPPQPHGNREKPVTRTVLPMHSGKQMELFEGASSYGYCRT